MRTVVKQITASIAIIEAGEELAERYTGGNFSKLVRWLIAAACQSDAAHRILAAMKANDERTQAEDAEGE